MMLYATLVEHKGHAKYKEKHVPIGILEGAYSNDLIEVSPHVFQRSPTGSKRGFNSRGEVQ